jgi:hypothetical protein
MANFTQIGLDLQGVLKRTYQNLLYQSAFYKFLNTSYIGEVRQTGTPVIEIIKQNATTLNTRQTPEMATATSPELATYKQVLVDLTELRMDYSFRIPVTITGSNIAGALQGQIDLNDSEVAKKIDVYGFGKMATAITGDRTSGKTAKDTGTTYEWSASTQQDYIDAINDCKAILFNLNVLNDYRLGLKATEHAKLVANLTTILKFETRAGVEGVDYGEVSSAYGVMIFPINDNVLTNSEIGYFASPIGVVGDTFFSAMAEYDGNYPGFPGYYVLEGNILFGASVVRPEAIVKLVAGE